MKKYMLLCCFDEARWTALPETERERIMRDYGAFIDSHIRSGRYLAGGKLEDSSAAATVTHKDGKPVVTDGPFAETREQIGGYHILECADFDEALAIAQRTPTLPAGGRIEVRPVIETYDAAKQNC